MPVIRVKKNDNYSVMSNYHLRDKNLSLKAIGLISIMLSLPDNWDYSIRGLASIRKESVPTIMNVLKEIEEAGYLIRTQAKDGNGRFCKSVYTILEKPCSKFLNTETLNSETLDSETFTQLSTKELSTKELSTKRVESTLSQQQYDLLINKYGKDIVDAKIANAAGYKNCMRYEVLEKWCAEEVEKRKHLKPKSTNRFNNFNQRNYTKEEFDELERRVFDLDDEEVETIERGERYVDGCFE